MKSAEKRIERAAAEVAERLRKQLADIRVAIQGKHQLTGDVLDAAMVMGLAEVLAVQEATADRLIETIAANDSHKAT